MSLSNEQGTLPRVIGGCSHRRLTHLKRTESPTRRVTRVIRTGCASVAVLISLTTDATGQRDTSVLASWDQVRDASSPWSSGTIIVGIEPRCDREQVTAELAKAGMLVQGEIPRLGILKVAIDATRGANEACLTALHLGGITFAEPEQAGRIQSPATPLVDLPDDTFFDLQWHLRNIGQFGGTPGASIEAVKAWEITAGSSDVVVAVLDTGIDYSHPELLGRVLQGYDFVGEDSDATGFDPHGLYVAGIIAAEADNTFGVAGVCPRCSILPVKVAGALGGLGTVFDMAQGIDYATAQGAAVINISTGFFQPSPALESAVAAAAANGITVVCAAGNDVVADTVWPAASQYAISVGATTDTDDRAPFSATGTAVDFVAPGLGVFTVAKQHGDACSSFTGTSASTAVASGVVALMKSYHPKLSDEQVYTLLKTGAADQVGDSNEDTPGWDPYYGHGRLSAFRSLTALCSCSAGNLFTVSPPKLTLGVDETWVFRVAAGNDYALRPYVVLGSLSGTAPGSWVYLTEWPLVLDRYSRLCLGKPSPIVGQAGLLDDTGQAVASLTIPAAARETLAGVIFHHAVAVYDSGLGPPIAGPPLIVSSPIESGVHGLPQRLYDEAFDAGAPGWVFDNGPTGQWHVAQPGECGAESHRAAYNSGEPGCSFGNGTTGTLISPSVVLSGLPPYRVRFSCVVDMPSAQGDTIVLRLVDDTPVAKVKTQEWAAGDFGEVVRGTAATYEMLIPESSKFEGRSVHLEVECEAPDFGTGQGLWLDDVSIWNGGSD